MYAHSSPIATLFLSTLFLSIPLPGMTPLVLLLQVVDREFGVVLERVQRLVAEQFLDVVHAGAPAQQFRRTAPAIMPSSA